MEKRLEQALEYSNFRLILAARQENLKVLLKNRLMLTYKNGLFKVDMTLINFVDSLLSRNFKEFIFIDSNDIPIYVTNLYDFFEALMQKYEKALDHYFKSYQKLEEAREIRKVINWDAKNE